MLRANTLAEGACYRDLRTRKWVAICILEQCYRICEGASLLRRLDDLAAIDFNNFTNRDNEARFRLHDLIISLDPPVLDAVRIATCFENLFKARLLLRGYIIHQIDKKALSSSYKYLADEQQARPIKISEIKHAEGLQRRNHDYAFQSLSSFTLTYSRLVTQEAYKTQLHLPPKLFKSLADIVDNRNNLHYLISANAVYTRSFIVDLLYIRRSFNRFVVRTNNALVKELQMHDISLKQEI